MIRKLYHEAFSAAHSAYRLLFFAFLVSACASTGTPKAVTCAEPAVAKIAEQVAACYLEGNELEVCSEIAGIQNLAPYLTCLLHEKDAGRKTGILALDAHQKYAPRKPFARWAKPPGARKK